MTHDDSHFTRCHSIIKRLNEAEGWLLSEQIVEEYAAKIAELVLEIASDAQLLKRVEQYHDDKVLVRAILDPDDPDHGKHWDDIFKEVSKTVYWRMGEKDHALLEPDDLIQIANINVIKSVKTFQFNSLFSTWLTRVVVNSIRQAKRDATAKKRSGPTDPIKDNFPTPAEQNPEEKGNATALMDLVRQVLMQHQDKRLFDIFLLAEVKGWSKTEIGQLLQLHPSRIRALLTIARNYLQQNPAIQNWLLSNDDNDNSS